MIFFSPPHPGLEYSLFLIRSWNEENAVDVSEWIEQASKLAQTEDDTIHLSDALVKMPGMPSKELHYRIPGLFAVDKHGQCLWMNDIGKMVVVPLTHFEEE